MVDFLADRPAGRIWTVGALVAAVAGLIEQGIPACTVSGEISGLTRAASGHCYFTLKDSAGAATLRCAMFRRAATQLDFEPVDGQQVEVRGRLSVYEPRGELQLVVEAMRRSGAGALYERFLRLRARLEGEGLFDLVTKRPLPSFPIAVGVVTSLGGAALHDVATTLARRSPHVRVVVYPSVVQGAEAPAALCAAIAAATIHGVVDVLVVCRGGGSLEDLWAFNDERVVRAIRAAPMPVVSGVGHETDVTLADLAADLRAPTPTAAAELVAPATSDQRQALDRLAQALDRRMSSALDTWAQRLDRLSLRLTRPGEGVARRRHVLATLDQRLHAALARSLIAAQARAVAAARRLSHALEINHARLASRFESASLRLHALAPDRVLARGYALLVDATGRPVTSIAGLLVGSVVSARLADGEATLGVESTRRSDTEAGTPLAAG
jgi:exodeoxyribonuclease VII large subunit